MLPEWGLVALIIAFVLSLLNCTLPLWGKLKLASSLTEQAHISLVFSIAQCFLVTISFMILVAAFLQNDFSVYYVAQHSNTHLPWYFQIGAVWGGHEGSLLLWALILSAWNCRVATGSRAIPPRVALTVQTVLSSLLVGFLGMILTTSNPFLRLLPEVPMEGADLNPLLQDITFMIHPPILYLGYVGLAIPFAFAIAECLDKDAIPARQWIDWVRPWALFAVAALALGITLGSWWAYYELGWGGWWFWDPVENASLMPWLIGCAYVHLLWVSRERPRLTAWRVMLAMVAFLLSLLGTFLTRSGVISTVHAFASDQSRGMYLLSFLSLVALGAGIIFLRKGKQTTAGDEIAPFSKHGLVFLGVLLLVVSTLSILLGTLYPLAIQTLRDETLSIGAPYFNTVITPLWLGCLLLMALAPLQGLWFRYRWSIGVALLGIGAFSVWCYQTASFSLTSAIGLIIAGGLVYATCIQLPRVWSQHHRWGYWLAHMGAGLTAIGIILSLGYESERSLSLSPGQSAPVGEYVIGFDNMVSVKGSNYEGIRAHFVVKKQDKTVVRLMPEKRFYQARDLVTTESALGLYRWTDFYIALGEPLGNDRWSFRLYTKPFVRFIWLGGILMFMGLLTKVIMLRAKRSTRQHTALNLINIVKEI